LIEWVECSSVVVSGLLVAESGYCLVWVFHFSRGSEMECLP
jgi:hypothetical protein